MKKMKFNLSEIKVSSFVTMLNPEMKKEILAGDDPASDTGVAGLCCNIASAEQPSFCKEKSYVPYCEED